jgi:two-component system, cell cycle response regulator
MLTLNPPTCPLESPAPVQLDSMTGVYNRETILSMLFRETDRAQRMSTSLCVILFDIDEFAALKSRLGVDACDELLRQVAARTTPLLRSYDLLGNIGGDVFLAVLPGCSPRDAKRMADRLRLDVFCAPFRVNDESIRLSAHFGLAASNGRSPLIVVREAEQALRAAKVADPESIRCFEDSPQPFDREAVAV